jgi:restriction endonuclease Mrr
MYQQQPPPEALLPHERVRPGCVISSIVGLILFWLYFTNLEIFIGNIWSWLLATGLCIALVGLLIMWLAYAKRRQREVQAAWYTWQQQRQAFAAYQDQQMQRFYASLEEQQRRQEEQQRRQEEQRRRQEEQQRQAFTAYQEQLMRRNYAYQEEQRRIREEQQRKERLAMVKTLGDLLVLSASEFEHRVADLFVLDGYSNVQITGGSGDLMADITCTSPDGEKVVVQCKRYARDHNVSSPEIQKFAGMVYAYHKADKGLFITTSSFTKPAIELGKALHIELIDGERLCQYFLKAEQVSTTL